MASGGDPRTIPWWVSQQWQLEIYPMSLVSRDSRQRFWRYCFRMPGHYRDLTVNNRACHCFAVIFFSRACLSDSPWGTELSYLTCDLTASFVILHNCCHPGKTKWFFSLWWILPHSAWSPSGKTGSGEPGQMMWGWNDSWEKSLWKALSVKRNAKHREDTSLNNI